MSLLVLCVKRAFEMRFRVNDENVWHYWFYAFSWFSSFIHEKFILSEKGMHTIHKAKVYTSF